MGARGLAALVVLLLASALLPGPASGLSRRVLEGEKPSSGEVAPAPTSGGSPKGDSPKESGQSSSAGQKAESHSHQESPPPVPSPSKDTKQGGEAQASTTPQPPPPPAQDTNSQKTSPPPGGLGPNGGGEAKSGTDQDDSGSQGKKDDMDKMKAAMEKCDTSHKCSTKEFSACLQASDHASVGSFIIVYNEGKNDIIVNIKEPSDIDKKPLHLSKGAFEQMNIPNVSGNITLTDGHGEDCFIHLGQSVESQSVSNWQQQIQMVAAYAARLNPIYGASFFIFTVVLVAVVCACCKFPRRRGNDAVPYQQLEMGVQAPNSSVVDNTTSTTDGWEDGWDDDWDDEEAAARPSDKKTTSSVSANGLSLRTQTNSKDGWDVDWDD